MKLTGILLDVKRNKADNTNITDLMYHFAGDQPMEAKEALEKY